MILNHDNLDKRGNPRIAVVYTHFPHYRAPVFSEMSASNHYDFAFYYDPDGIETTVASGSATLNHFVLRTRRFGKIMWQSGAAGLALSGDFDGFIFLGNPFILSTWLAAALCRLRGKPVLFWTHGWTRRETGPKARIRRAFYHLANMLLVYSNRAREIGIHNGFPDNRIKVINNSLGYEAQKLARSAALAADRTRWSEDTPDGPFFLSVTRLVPEVRLDLALEAMARLPERPALVVVGSGPERERLGKIAQELGVRVWFLGAIYDEERLAHLFIRTLGVVSPGKIGLLALHALAYGAPVITHGDLDRQMPEVEAIEPGVTGAFFRFGDVNDLARKMQRLLGQQADDHARAKCRAAAVGKIESGYTPQAQVELITAALDVLIRRGN